MYIQNQYQTNTENGFRREMQATMYKIKSIHIKNMHNVKDKIYEFNSNTTYFVGKNGSGKSTILQAIALGLLGYIPGTNKYASDIYMHSSGDPMEIVLTLVGEDSQEVIIQDKFYKDAKGKVQRDRIVRPDTISIEDIVSNVDTFVFNYTNLVSMTANQLKSWWVSYLATDDDEIVDWKQALVSGISDMVIEDIGMDYVNSLADDLSTYIKDRACHTILDKIQAANEYLKLMQSSVKKELKSVESSLQSMVYYTDFVNVTIEDCASAEKALEEHIKTLSRLQDMKAKSNKYNKNLQNSSESNISQEEYEKLVKDVDVTKNWMNKYTISRKSILDCISKINNNISILKSLNNMCPVLNTPCESLVKHNQSKLNGRDPEVELQRVSKELQTYESELDRLDKRYQSAISFYNQAVQKIAQHDAIANASNEILDIPMDLDDKLSSMESIVKRDRETVQKMHTNLSNIELRKSMTADKYRLSLQQDILKRLVQYTDASHWQLDIVQEKFMDMQQLMNDLYAKIGSMVQTTFHIVDKANSFYMGIVRDGREIPYDLMSSGEKGVFAIIMMIACMQYKNNVLPIIVIDDMLDHMDSENFSKIFKLLSTDLGLQCILAGVLPVDSSDRICVCDVE